ncbi:MAG: polyamine aminopropyltransferase [Calditrichaeota bacterium]|nr:polyamine aminopropyltransferase [Calditrichota bacterium]
MTTSSTPGRLWFTEYHTPDFGITFRVRETLARRVNAFQTVDILDTVEMGRMLVIDGLVMTSERDEAPYHEMLVHVPMFAHPDPKRVLVIGGGDGGSLREIVKHRSVERVVQVEIDNDVVELCREYLPGIAAAYDHPKVELVIGDAIAALKDMKAEFDVIVVDGSDPVGPAEGLFGRPFFTDLRDALSEGGLAAGQIGSPFLSGPRVTATIGLVRDIFADGALYLAHTPTYLPGLWSFFAAAKEGNFPRSADKVRYSTFSAPLRYYNGDIHEGAFCLPQYVRDICGAGGQPSGRP